MTDRQNPAADLHAPFAGSFYDTQDLPPWDFYEDVRAAGDVVWDAGMNAWLVVGYELAREVLRHDQLYAHPYANMGATAAWLKVRSNNPRSFHFLSGEQHKAMHRWYMQDLLSPTWVEKYRPVLVDEVVRHSLTRLAGRSSFEVFGDFAEWIPLGVFARLLGLPDDDDTLLRIRRLNDVIAEFTILANALKLERDPSPADLKIAADAALAGQELDALLMPVVKARRAGTGDDFVSRLWAGGPAIFADWNEMDTLDACRRLLFAGTDTTTHAIANVFYMLLTDTDLLARVRAGDASIVERFIEEALRLNGSVQFRPRRLSADTTLNGVPLKAGDMVVVFLLAANRDAAHYACPHAVDLARDKPRDHIAFNYGIRTCLGAALARAELAAAVTQALALFPTLRLDATAPAPRPLGLLRRTYRPLHVRVD